MLGAPVFSPLPATIGALHRDTLVREPKGNEGTKIENSKKRDQNHFKHHVMTRAIVWYHNAKNDIVMFSKRRLLFR
jgi:hypothetical protein